MMTTLPELDGVAGAAFLLRTPCREGVALQHEGAVVTVRENAPYVTVQLPQAPSNDTLRSEAWRLLQEALDIHAATHRQAIGTHRGESENLAWVRRGSEYQLTFTNTADITWFGSIRMITGSTPSGPPTTHVVHDPSFRFYRLSQLTDDLFDAYRNAYLSLECLVSSVCDIRGRESEKEWLKRALHDHLSAGVPTGMDISAIVEDVYNDGRLPLFHAKTQRSFYAPQGRNRERVQVLFGKLNLLLASLFRYKFGPCFAGGWGSMAQVAMDASARAVLGFDGVVYKNGDERAFCQAQVEVVEKPRRFGNLWARLRVAPPAGVPSIDGVELRHGAQDWMSLSFPEFVPMARVAVVTFEICVLCYHTNAPKLLHAM